VAEKQNEKSDNQKSKIRHYADILNPLFWDSTYNEVHRMFEWACTMVRVTGLQDTGWDSYTESVALLEDFRRLQLMALPAEEFPNPSNTQARLALFSYAHLLEMSMPYDLLANLLRLKLCQPYVMHPLAHLNERSGGKNGKPVRVKPATPLKKIGHIKELAVQARLPQVGAALEGIYDATVRNAIFHSDYALHNKSIRLLSGNWLSKRQGIRTQLIPFDELAEITNEAFAFHSALLALWRRQKQLCLDFRGRILPFDDHYKAVVEFTFDGHSLDGFRTYWPNGMIGTYRRHADGRSDGLNLAFRSDGSIDFFVGIYAERPSAFSPLVEDGAAPNYSAVPDTDFRPHWPEDLRPYAIPLRQ
jgi:hypothetical protein